MELTDEHACSCAENGCHRWRCRDDGSDVLVMRASSGRVSGDSDIFSLRLATKSGFLAQTTEVA
jgi:hypothetical protein